jgi:hypothetical protein
MWVSDLIAKVEGGRRGEEGEEGEGGEGGQRRLFEKHGLN